MAHILPEMIADILVRLPVKSLLRFKCISKPLCSQIESQDFSKLLLHHSHKRLILSSDSDCNLYMLDFPSLDEPYQIYYPFEPSDCNTKVHVVGSCNGLLCLVKPHNQLCLWNPSTRKHFNLEEPPITWTDPNSWYSVYGLGYDSIHDDYNLLRIVLLTFDDFCDSQVDVYSLKSNLWTDVMSLPYPFPTIQSRATFVCGSFHFMMQSFGRWRSFILAIDLRKRQPYREVPLPPEVLDRESCDVGVGVLNECLSVACHSDKRGTVGVWVLKHYGADELWSKIISFSVSKDMGVMAMKPLTTFSSGVEVILHVDNFLIRHDLRKKRRKAFTLKGMLESFSIDVCVESLVSPMPTSLPDI